MGYKVDKIKLLNLIEKNDPLYKNFYLKIMELYKTLIVSNT
jgi:hypothetical protein